MASSFNTLPKPIVERVGRFFVVRDDYLPGGTKMRYMLPLIAEMPEYEIVYASPAVGYAQIALAHVCAMLGKQATIFVAKRKTPHYRTLQAKEAGAKIFQVPCGYLSNVQSKAKKYSFDFGAKYIPWGVDIPEAQQHFKMAASQIEIVPNEVWCCSGSGTLIRGLQLAWPLASFHAVRVGAMPNIGAAKLHTAPEKFENKAKTPPPYPSCDNYDAKTWQFVNKIGAKDALIWNVGS